jgi:hypothetical protein
VRLCITPILLVSVVLSGCGANYNSIYRFRPITTQGKSITTLDAKQRVIVQSEDKFCTEPPPDVFSVYAQSLAASGNVSKSADPTSLGVSANLAYSSSEQGATIGRTQAYNLLALLVYYNCLSSLNKDAGPLDAPIDRARLQRLIPLTEAIEQMTGVLRPPTVIIGANGIAGASNGGESAVRLDDAHKATQTAATTLAKAKKTKGDLEGADPKCSVLSATVAAGTALTKEDEKKKKDDCDKADKAVADATTTNTDAAAHYEAMRKATEGGSVSAQAGVVSAQVIQAMPRDEQTVQKAIDAVKEIVLNNADLDEIQFFCMRMISDAAVRRAALEVSGGASISEQCVSYLLASVRSEQDKFIWAQRSG